MEDKDVSVEGCCGEEGCEIIMVLKELQDTANSWAPHSGVAVQCPKCKEQGAQYEFMKQFTVNLYDGEVTAGLNVEHLKRKCYTCGFEWRERCADAAEGLLVSEPPGEDDIEYL